MCQKKVDSSHPLWPTNVVEFLLLLLLPMSKRIKERERLKWSWEEKIIDRWMISFALETYRIKSERSTARVHPPSILFSFSFLETNSSNQQQSYKCPYCTDEFLQINHLHLHTSQCHPEQTENLISCIHCNAVFTNKVGVRWLIKRTRKLNWHICLFRTIYINMN